MACKSSERVWWYDNSNRNGISDGITKQGLNMDGDLENIYHGRVICCSLGLECESLIGGVLQFS